MKKKFLKLIEKMVEKGWGNLKDILKELSPDFTYPSDENEIISNINDKNNEFNGVIKIMNLMI